MALTGDGKTARRKGEGRATAGTRTTGGPGPRRRRGTHPRNQARIYLVENAAALEIEPTAGGPAERSRSAPVDGSAGARYPESCMVAVNR